MFLRTAFVGILAMIALRVSLPQSERIWSVYETPGDLVRLALGLAFCAWIVFHLFSIPRDAEGYRIWVRFGIAAVPFALICLIAIW